jgi:hypothetical protein
VSRKSRLSIVSSNEISRAVAVEYYGPHGSLIWLFTVALSTISSESLSKVI